MMYEKNGIKYVWKWETSTTCRMLKVVDGKPVSLGEWTGKVPSSIEELLSKFGE